MKHYCGIFLNRKIQEAGDFNKNPHFLQFNPNSALSISRALFVQGFLEHNLFGKRHGHCEEE